MTDPEMEGVARQALNLMRKDIERNRSFGALIASYHEGEGIHRMKTLENTITEALGEDWLNNGTKKDFAFGLMAWANKLVPVEAMILATAINKFEPTEKFRKLPIEEQRKYVDTNHDDHHRMAKKGLLEIKDGFVVVVQTEARVCICTAVNGEKLDTKYWDQSDFAGRMKMFNADTSFIEQWIAKKRGWTTQ